MTAFDYLSLTCGILGRTMLFFLGVPISYFELKTFFFCVFFFFFTKLSHSFTRLNIAFSMQSMEGGAATTDDQTSFYN